MNNHKEILSELRSLAHRLHENERKSKYWISKDGRKFAYYSPNTKLHQSDILRYSNIESIKEFNGETVYPLPKDGYPYTIEFSYNPIIS